MEKTKKKASLNQTQTVQRLVESAIMIALATVLSLIKLIDLPYSGSVTIASAVPLIIIAYRYGVGWGCLTGFVYSLLQLVTSSSLSYVTGFWSVVAVIGLDFFVAFMVVGIAGIFRKIENQSLALMSGAILYGFLRFVCHFISGATVWAGISIPTKAAALYSFSYNLTYMLPETIIMAAVAWFLGSALDFKSSQLVRLPSKEVQSKRGGLWKGAAIAIASATLVYDTATIFIHTQNADSGEFSFAGLSEVKWLTFAIINAVAIVAIIISVIYNKKVKSSESVNDAEENTKK
jgi:thiamine transporter